MENVVSSSHFPNITNDHSSLHHFVFDNPYVLGVVLIIVLYLTATVFGSELEKGLKNELKKKKEGEQTYHCVTRFVPNKRLERKLNGTYKTQEDFVEKFVFKHFDQSVHRIFVFRKEIMVCQTTSKSYDFGCVKLGKMFPRTWNFSLGESSCDVEDNSNPYFESISFAEHGPFRMRASHFVFKKEEDANNMISFYINMSITNGKYAYIKDYAFEHEMLKGATSLQVRKMLRAYFKDHSQRGTHINDMVEEVESSVPAPSKRFNDMSCDYRMGTLFLPSTRRKGYWACKGNRLRNYVEGLSV